MSRDNSIRFFTGTNSRNGFFSVFDKIYNVEDGWNAYLIKGGPGSGKSSLMKKLGDSITREYGCVVEYIHCSSDPDSLDGIILPEHNVCVLDATPPHALEPKYPGACEHIVNVTSCWDDGKLYGAKDDISALSGQCSAYHKTAQVYIKAAAGIDQNIHNKAQEHLNLEKLQKYTEGLCKKELMCDKKCKGRESLRLLSAISPKGVIQFGGTAEHMCDRIICIHDELGPAADHMLKIIRDRALQGGLDVISCIDPIQPDCLEHVLLPGMRLAIMSNKNGNKLEVRRDKNIYAKRFYDMNMLNLHRQKIVFGKRVIADLIGQAAEQMKQAKLTHDLLERHYINAMNFELLDKLYLELYKEIAGIIA